MVSQRGLSDGVRAQRLAAQLLAGPPAPGPEAVARHLLAVQAQDPRGARLAVRARTAGLTAEDVDAALADRRLVVSWLCRGTLHLVAAEDLFWLHDLTTPRLRTACRRRLAQEGVSEDQSARAVGLIARWLAEDGPLTRDELAARLRARRVPVAGQAMVHILFHATLEGLIVRGPMRGRRQAFVRAEDWLGARPPVRDRGQALAELVRRYLTGHAPASDDDIARWAGLPLRDIRAGLGRIVAEIAERPDGLLELAGRTQPGGRLRPRLLGAFDPVLVGWRDRGWLTGAEDARLISGGVFRPFILLAGGAGGLWRLDGDRVRMELFAPPDDATRRVLEADAEDVLRYLGLGGSDRA